MNRWEKHLASKRRLCSGCGKVHYMSARSQPGGEQSTLRLTAKGWRATDPTVKTECIMSRPVEGIAPFKGEAAEWLASYLERTKPDPKKREKQEARDAELLTNVKESPSITSMTTNRSTSWGHLLPHLPFYSRVNVRKRHELMVQLRAQGYSKRDCALTVGLHHHGSAAHHIDGKCMCNDLG